MLEELFGSKTRSALIAVLVREPARRVHLRELVRETGGSVSGVQREIERLERMGLVRSRITTSGRREVTLVSDHPLADPLAGLVAAESTAVYVPAGDVSASLDVTVAGRLNPHVRHLAPRVAAECRRFGALSAAIFGSATELDITVVPRDLDVAVRFDVGDTRSPAELYFGLHTALEHATGMPVDLLEIDTVDNPYLARELSASKVVLYEEP